MEIKKALTFRASSIGDCLMGKYLLENVHAAFPEARCTLLVASKSDMVRDLLAAYPWIEVREANTKRPQSILSVLKDAHPSDATVTQYSGRGKFSTGSKLFARILTRRGRLVGFTDPWPFNTILYDHLIPFDDRKALRLHECEALAALGVPITFPEVTLLPQPGNTILESIGLQPREYIVLNLLSSTVRRGLSLPHQIDIARAMQQAFGQNKKIILTGGPSDTPVVQKIAEVVHGLLPAGHLTMQDLTTLISSSAGAVSLDTGTGHISAQTGVPLVILRTCWGYNWWNKDQYARAGIRILSHEELCATGHVSKDYPDCLGTITPAEVVQAYSDLM